MLELFFFILGTFFGSFSNVVIRRLPYGNSIVRPASHCPKCLIPIKWIDNLPVISFLFLGGKCRNCKTKISFEYPVVELLAGLLFLFGYLNFGIQCNLIIFLILSVVLIIISFIDMHLRIIPDILTISLLIFGLASSFFNPVVSFSFLNSLKGTLFGGVFLYLVAFLGSKIYRKEVMGGGDVKLLAAGGSFLGLSNIFLALLIACFIGGLTGLFLILIGKKKKSDFIPFGPFIAISIVMVFFIRPQNVFLLASHP
ncbi:MAG: prepilin peptidase [Elusimicrobia bacterium CG06_land_8_20_14_3_00_38_11]|nr:MAG: prepilin peptidase [Elusimicrobia bacterium CG06_land_8_20_14_3_00_38_11]